MNFCFTRMSTLRPLAELIDAINQDWKTDSAQSMIDKAVAESKLLQVVGATIVRELDEFETRHRNMTQDALREVAIELAIEESLQSSPDKMVQVKDDDIVRILMKPIAPALILERVARSLKAETPDIVRKTIDLLNGEQ
jgi:hypothetical protein